jgi:DNA replication protein DnaC
MNDSIRDTIKVDTARLPLLLNELRLPTIAALWPDFTERADREGWPAARLLATLAELELAERSQRRIQRHLTEARLPPDKTLDSIDFTALPMLSRAHVTALASGDGWISTGGTILLFGPSGSGKSHLAAAFGHTLVENGYRVLFTRTTDLVQRLQQARQALTLESAIEKLDKYHLLILDDLCYVRKDQAETSVLFELIGNCCQRDTLATRAACGEISRAGGERGQEWRLYRLGAQNSRMAITARGISRWAPMRAASVNGPGGGAPRTGLPLASAQCARIGSSHGCACPRAGSSSRQNVVLSWMAA